MVASALKDAPEAVLTVPSGRLDVLRVAAIYGANASGKSNAIRALQFVCSAVENSQVRWKPQERIPVQPFRMNRARASQPTSFRIDFVVGDTTYEYSFSVDVEKVLSESLASFPEGRRRLLFIREREKYRFGKFFSGPNQFIKDVTRPNSLFLSAAAQNNHEMVLPIYTWFAERARFVLGPRDEPNDYTMAVCSDSRKALLEHLLVAADLGLAGVDFKERDLSEETQRVKTALATVFPDAAEKFRFPERVAEVAFRHRCENGEQVRFGPADESSGTLAYFGLLGPIIDALGGGGLLCIDELERSIHPLLALEIVGMFNDRDSNPRGAQLIFNTHDSNLLDAKVLRRDQVWFTEKDGCGATHLYALTDFKPRRGENLERGYLHGRYGGVPFLRPEMFNTFGDRSGERVADGE